ncbi:MAG: tail fiber protein, partial [Mycoplasma sp.]
NDTAGSTKPETDYPHSPKVVSPRTLNYALKNYLPKKAKAVDSDKLDGLDSSQFIRRDIDQTMLGKLTFTNDTVLEWSRNTDGACIGFKNDGDSDVDSYMYFQTFDNGNEFFKWEARGTSSGGGTRTELMTLKTDHLRFKGNAVYHTAHKPSANDVGAYSKSEADSRFVNVTGDSMSGTLNSNGITSATVYSFERIPTYAAGSKTYLRKFRGGLNDTIWHETVRSGTYQLSTGSTDSSLQLEISNSALSVTNGYKIGGTTVIESDAKIHWNKLKGIPSATVSAQGIVQLNDSLNSSSTTQAATPNAIRVLKELIDSKAGIQGAVMDDLKIKNWIRIGNVILRPNPTN